MMLKEGTDKTENFDPIGYAQQLGLEMQQLITEGQDLKNKSAEEQEAWRGKLNEVEEKYKIIEDFLEKLDNKENAA